MLVCVVMGVAGCGKSTVGAAAAKQLNASYVDGDDLHPAANIEKMSRGEPLNDEDRKPWLIAIGTTIRDANAPLLIGCSALKRTYRDLIRETAGKSLSFLHLHGTRDVLIERMKNRPGHFMPVSLLDSQLDTLELPDPDENAIQIDIDQPFDAVVSQSVSVLSKLGPG